MATAGWQSTAAKNTMPNKTSKLGAVYSIKKKKKKNQFLKILWLTNSASKTVAGSSSYSS